MDPDQLVVSVDLEDEESTFYVEVSVQTVRHRGCVKNVRTPEDDVLYKKYLLL